MGDLPRPDEIVPDPSPEERWTPAMRAARQALQDPSLPEDKRNQILDLLDQAARKNGINLSLSVGAPPAGEPPTAEPAAAPDEPQRLRPEDFDVYGPPFPRRLNLPQRYVPPGYDGGRQQVVYDREKAPDETPGQYRVRNEQHWAQTLENAKRMGVPVVRHGETRGMERFAANVEPYITAALDTIDKGVFAGVPGLVAGEIDEHIMGGNDRPIAEHIREVPEGEGIDLPGIRGASTALEVGNSMLPMSAANRLAAPIVKGGGNLLTRIAQASAAGGVGELMSNTVDAVGRTMRGDEQRSPVDIGTDVGIAGLLSGALLKPIEAVGNLANKVVKWTRGSPDLGEHLNNAELGGAEIGWLGGLEPPPALRGAQQVQAQPRGMPGVKRSQSGRSAQDILDDEAARSLHDTVGSYRDRVPKEIKQAKAPYLEHPEVQQKRLSAVPVVAKLQERIATGMGDDGLPLPAAEIEADREVLAAFMRGEYNAPGEADVDGTFSVEEARRMGLPFDETSIGSTADELVGQTKVQTRPDFQRMAVRNRPSTVLKPPKDDPDAPDELDPDELPAELTIDQAKERGLQINTDPYQRQYVRELEQGGRVSATEREFSIDNIEKMIRDYRAAAGLGDKRAEKTEAKYAVLKALYKMRDDYPSVPGYGKPPTEPGQPQFESPRAMFSQMQDRMADLENVLETVKLPKTTDEVGADKRKQYEAMLQVAKTFRSLGVADHEASDAFRELLAGNADTAERLVEAAAGRGYQTVLNQLTSPFRVIVSDAGTRGYGILNAISTRARLAADRAAQEVAGIRRSPTQLGGQVSTKPGGINTFDPDTQIPRGRDEPHPGLSGARAARAGSALAGDNGEELLEDLQWLYNATTGGEKRKRKEPRR